MRLACLVISAPAALLRLAPAWSDLLARSQANEPMLAPLWLVAWWRTFASRGGRRLRVLTFHEGGRLVGLAPLLVRAHWHRPFIPFRRLECLGSGEDEADEICSEYLNIIVERRSEEAVAGAFAAALCSGALGPWDELVIPSMDGRGEMPALLARALSRRGLCAEVNVTGQAPYIPLPVTWDAYLKALPSSHRYLITRSLRDFERWAAGAAELKVAASLEEVESALSTLSSLHAERWRADGKPGMFASPRFRAFHGAVMPELFARGALELITLAVRGEPIAAHYNILWNERVYFYQCGRKLGLPKHIRPGVVAHAFAIQRAITMGRREYDFLGGDRRYKAQLAPATRPLVQLRAVRGELREAARRLAAAGLDQARRFRRALGLTPRAAGGSRPLAP